MSALEFVEACRQPTPVLADWLRGIAVAAESTLGPHRGLGGYTYSERNGGIQIIEMITPPGSELTLHPEYGKAAFLDFVNATPAYRKLFTGALGATAPHVMTLSQLPTPVFDVWQRQLPPRAGDSLGLIGGLFRGEGIHLCYLAKHTIALSPQRRRYLQALAEHLGMAYRARRAIEVAGCAFDAAAAVASHDGRLLHATGRMRDRAMGETFIDSVRLLERTRSITATHGTASAEGLWGALVCGEYSLVDFFDSDGKRMILAVRTRSGATRLTRTERLVAEGVARGASNKRVGGLLGISASTVAVHLSSAMRKLGIPGRESLATWFAAGEKAPGRQKIRQ